MDTNSKYFLSLLTAFLYGTVPEKPADIDWEQIYDLSRIHSLSGAVYLAVQKLGEDDKPDQSILNKFKSDFFHTNLLFEEQEKEYQRIAKKLNEEKLEHLFFKGIVLREYYPVKQMRTLGDIDFLLHEKDHMAVNDALIQIGYRSIPDIGHWQYEKGKLLVEAHSKLIYNSISSKVDSVSYFENAWNHASAKENSYTYELNLEYHCIYLLAHIAKHLCSNGCGVRMIFDIAVILHKFGDSLDEAYLWQELRSLKLDAFAENIFALCAKWFQTDIPGTAPKMEDTTFENLSTYILEGGTFGFNNRSLAMRSIRQEYDKGSNLTLSRLKTFASKLFPSYATLKHKYPNILKTPLLVPFVWAIHGYKCVFRTPKTTMNILNGLISSSTAVENSHNLLVKIGLLE